MVSYQRANRLSAAPAVPWPVHHQEPRLTNRTQPAAYLRGPVSATTVRASTRVRLHFTFNGLDGATPLWYLPPTGCGSRCEVRFREGTSKEYSTFVPLLSFSPFGVNRCLCCGLHCDAPSAFQMSLPVVSFVFCALGGIAPRAGMVRKYIAGGLRADGVACLSWLMI